VKCVGAIQAKFANCESMLLCPFDVLGLVFIKVLLKTCYSWYFLDIGGPTEDWVTFPMEFLIGRLLLVFIVLSIVLE